MKITYRLSCGQWQIKKKTVHKLRDVARGPGMKGQKLHVESGGAERAGSSVSAATAEPWQGRIRDGATAEQVSDQKPAGARVPGGMPRSLPADCESLERFIIAANQQKECYVARIEAKCAEMLFSAVVKHARGVQDAAVKTS